MSLRQQTGRNLGIIAGMDIFSKLLGSITLIVLARLLLPADFGIIAIVYLLLGGINLFSELGFGDAIIQRRDRIEESVNTGFTINLILSGFLFVAIIILAPLWAAFYNDSNITHVTWVLAISILLTSFSFVPSVRLRKDLMFKKFAVTGIVSELSNSCITIYLAFAGWGYWSLVYGGMVSTIVKLLLLYKVSPWKPKIIFDKQIAKELFKYGKHIFAANIIIFINTNVDRAMGGKLIGLTALGYYLMAFQWSTFSKRIMGISEKVMFPTYAKIQGDIPKLKRGYLDTLKYVSMLTFPISLGVFTIAPEFVVVVLGEKWVPAIMPMQILCFYGLFESLSGTTGSVFAAVGKPKILRDLAALRMILLLLFIYFLTFFGGLTGLCLATTIAVVLSAIPSIYYLLQVLDISLTEYFNTLKPIIISTIIALVVTLLIKKYSIDMFYLSTSITLILSFTTFSTVYLIIFALIDRKSLLELVQLVKSFLSLESANN